jgi:diaminopimelate decarboxylase
MSGRSKQKGTTPEAIEIADAVEFLQANPEIAAKVEAVFAKHGAKLYPSENTNNDTVAHWRSIAKDLAEKPKDDFDREEPFFMVDLARIVVQMARFRKNLPRVQPFYAVKCNDTEIMLEMLSALGGSYDCASRSEFERVLDLGLARPENIVFAHPCKMIHNLREAQKRGVHMCTFDNYDELSKIERHMPSARCLLRIATDDSAAVCELSSKFGATMDITEELLLRAKDLGVNVVGVSFHVGSGNSSPTAYTESIANARTLFDLGAKIGHEMTVLDIGGGFPGTDPTVQSNEGITMGEASDDADESAGAMNFETIAANINPLLDEMFPDDTTVIIAEPGRFFAEATYTIAMNVHSKRVLKKAGRPDEFQYYVSDGKYGSFNCMIYDHQKPKFHLLHPDDEAATRNTTIFGPTCDGFDFLLKRLPCPELDLGEWIYVPNFGAYTVAAGSAFNGFETRRVEYLTTIDFDFKGTQ